MTMIMLRIKYTSYVDRDTYKQMNTKVDSTPDNIMDSLEITSS